jgi:UDP-GlcNAc:undecaprenyl-phosphate GlcNAc-1-phosphate transferase
MLFLVVIIASFFSTFSLMPKIISFSIKKRFFDDPKGDALKVHKTPIPYLGGVGIFIGFLAPLLSLYIANKIPTDFLGVLLGSILIISLGLWDDLKNVKPTVRLGGQLLATGLTIYFGYKINTFPFYYIAAPLTIIYILGSINSVNLFDGLDGLAGGVVSISLIGFCLLFYMQGNDTYLIISLALLGAILGFIPYNFNPAKIFMGDNGSTFLGYMLAVLAINASYKPYDITLFVIPIMLIGLPISDTAMAIIRRFLKGGPIFIGDRSHIYDQLVDKGFSVKQTVVTCYIIQAFFATFAVYWLSY